MSPFVTLLLLFLTFGFILKKGGIRHAILGNAGLSDENHTNLKPDVSPGAQG